MIVKRWKQVGNLLPAACCLLNNANKFDGKLLTFSLISLYPGRTTVVDEFQLVFVCDHPGMSPGDISSNEFVVVVK